jgi:molybdate/tungstate transport system substrate-binding protein
MNGRHRSGLSTALLLLAVTACDGAAGDGPLVVYAAGSLARPMRAALDSFAAASGLRYQLETAGSLEAARRITELGKVPDLVVLADEDVFPGFLVPTHVQWFVAFAGNRMVVAMSERRRERDEARAGEWWERLLEAGVETGRSDPDLDPAGYRTLMVFTLAESQAQVPGLAARLEERAPRRNMRAKSAELVALLQAGELDYAWVYESTARAARLPYLPLPSAIDLGSREDSAAYARVMVRVLGATHVDTVEMRGAPIRYAFSVPLRAPHPALGLRFAHYLLSAEGEAALASEHLVSLPEPEAIGEAVPEAIVAAVRLAAERRLRQGAGRRAGVP